MEAIRKNDKNSVKQMESKELTDACIRLDKEMKMDRQMMNIYKAELQARGLMEMDDHNLKKVEYYGNDGSAYVMDSLSLDILSPDKLKELVGEGLWSGKVKTTTETKYKCDAKFERMLKAVFTDSYTFEIGLEEFLDSMPIKPDAAQKKLLLKKLKGEFKKDRDVLNSVLIQPGEQKPDWDVELWYIYNIKNAELIRAMLPEEFMDDTIAKLKKCILVESKVSITLDYEEE